MKKMRFMLIVLCILCFSCKKYLDVKPDSSLTVPSTVVDLQMLMENYSTLNSQYPIAGELMADDYYTESWNNLPDNYRDAYIWGGSEFDQDASWLFSYRHILTFNNVLDNIDKVSFKKNEAELVNYVKGSALFFRAFYFYGLTQLFTRQYDPNTAKNDLGIVIRNTSNFNIRSVRSTNEETYEKIISNLKESMDLLPESQSSPNRPTKAAASGLLSRVYLSMKEYANAGNYADKALAAKAELMNFNELNVISNAPIGRFNKEVIFPMTSGSLMPAVALVDSTLVKSYHENDLRKSCFYRPFANGYAFKGDYDGTGFGVRPFIFAGIATDEMYLIKAECQARAGNVNSAMQTLNNLLITRWKTGTFIPLTAQNANEALIHILTERRKELVFRTVRWGDLRRLQNDPLFSVTPKRIVNGQEYTLRPNSPRYVLKIPLKVIQESGIPQNP